MSNVSISQENSSTTLTKAHLVHVLMQQMAHEAYTPVSKRDAKEMVDTFFDLIAKTLMEGQNVKIQGFGNFQLRSKSSRPGRNPRTGESALIEERQVVTFHPSNQLKHQMDGDE